MKQAPNALYKSLRWLVLASACLATFAYADDYTDVSQLMRTNQFPQALTRADSYLATKPADPQMRFLKGVIQRNLGKTNEAVATFTQLTQDYPELPEPYNNLAVLYSGQGQYDKARLALEMAIRTNPSYATAHENLGDVYARLASQAYSRALQLDSNNANVPPKLALLDQVLKPNLGPAPVPPVARTNAASQPEPESVPLDARANKAVEEAVLAWAKAWSAKNMTAYLKAYSPDFTPPGEQTRAAWEKKQHDRIVGPQSNRVKLTDLKIRVEGDQAVASFRQTDKADSLSVPSQKTLVLNKSGQQWLIARESADR